MGKIDKFLNKWVSKKLFAVAISAILLAIGKLASMEFAGIVAIYLAGQSYVDRAKEGTVSPDKEYPDTKEG